LGIIFTHLVCTNAEHFIIFFWLHNQIQYIVFISSA
jgi:hypothetical protein